MKLARLIAISALLVVQSSGRAQEREQDPLLGNYRLGNSAEIVLLWAERTGNNDSNQRIFNVHTGAYSPVSLRCDAGRVRGADASASMAAHHRLTFR